MGLGKWILTGLGWANYNTVLLDFLCIHQHRMPVGLIRFHIAKVLFFSECNQFFRQSKKIVYFCKSKTNKEITMQTAANYQDMSAVDALWTLYRQQSQWVRDALRDRINSQDEKQESEQLKPYTMEEINAMLDAAEADIAAGRTTPHEESMRQARERIARKARMKREESVMAEAV